MKEMMKTKHFTLPIIIMLLLAGCADLDLQPLNSATDDQFYSDGKNLEAGLYGIYDALQGTYMFGHQILLDGLSDNLITTDRSDI